VAAARNGGMEKHNRRAPMNGSSNGTRGRTKRGTPKTPSIQSLDRGLFILEAVSRASGPVALSELTELLGVDRSSAFRLANTLRRRGFLANPNGRKDYIIGPSIWRLSRKQDWHNVLVNFSEDYLRKLAFRTGETTHLAVREGRQVFFLHHYHSGSQVLMVSARTGEFSPLHSTAHGKALLVDYGLDELKSLLGGPLERYTPQTIVSFTDLARSCALGRERGFIVDDEEYVEGVRCLAAPVRDRDGTVIAAIGISAPETRLSRDRAVVVAQQVCKTAEELSALFSAEEDGRF
jgi:DNA-binding IclR family transcriptional regulator